MADDNWKSRVGIEINFCSDDEENNGDGKSSTEVSENTFSPVALESPNSSVEGKHFFADDILNKYADYGSTPPRTRISRRQRERKQRTDEQLCTNGTKTVTKVIHAKAARRNTIDSFNFSDLMDRSESPQQQSDRSSSASKHLSGSKRSLKLLRGSERDLKLDLSSTARVTQAADVDDRAESMPVMTPLPAMKVETCNRFMSLTSKLVACRAFNRQTTTQKPALTEEEQDGATSRVADRVDFYNTFSLLIRMGSGEKQNPRRTMSREEHLWQNELKDLIWLELQAWHANRKPTEQDEYLCKAREGITALLNEIMEYKFHNTVQQSTPSSDTLLTPDLVTDDQETQRCAVKLAEGTELPICESGSTGHADETDAERKDVLKSSSSVELCKSRQGCTGCLSMYCHQCNDAQELALKEVEALLSRLDAAEALYPSSNAFATQFPLYKRGALVARVKAMCCWYNVTRLHRLKLRILGKLLMLSLFQDKRYRWPGAGGEEEGSVSSSSGVGTDTSGSDDHGIDVTLSRSSSVEEKQRQLGLIKRTVQFDVDSNSSPSDSNNSNASSHDSEINDRLREIRASISQSAADANAAGCKNPYRRYIEDVLKTRGLRKALSFLESLHTTILLKSMLTLEKPQEEEKIGDGGDREEGTPLLASDEMRRYGYWSPECRAMQLPSYRPAFLFLSRIPLDVIHEFLAMRLEQKPEQPSELSIRQLMRELKEGLRIASAHRARYLHLVQSVLWDDEEACARHVTAAVEEFDATVERVTDVYLDYLRRWLEMAGTAGRNAGLEEEWAFARSVGGGANAGDRFCRMASTLLKSVSDFLESSVENIAKGMDRCENCGEENTTTRRCMLTVFRDLQSLFNVARTRALKAVAFAKTLRKDLEEDHSSNADALEALQQLKLDAVSLCHTVTRAIATTESTCDTRNWWRKDIVEDLQGRCREILHQAYKFAFEYHKEAYRLATGKARCLLSRQLVMLARQWMAFVRTRCERGRGLRPRWANQGLDFLMTVCEPNHTAVLSDQEFEELKTEMDGCISHVVGQPPSAPVIEQPPSPMSSGAASPRGSVEHPRSPLPPRKFRSFGHRRTPSGNVVLEENPATSALSRQDRVLSAVSKLDQAMDDRLKSNDLIGRVTGVECVDKIHVRLRSVTFGWQRGIKIGQGSYGKVYTAVNNQTGELMAMKEIQLQPNDHRTIRRVAEELRIFEGIKHRHLVRYYGVEIHREEMLIFMEFCAEGTLASLVAGTEDGLPEALIRRYTRQLLQAVACLHRHGVVHRDVKSANIFLTDEGNCLKLGDFGSAVKIKSHTTVPGELLGFVGTQAYMAPEVFMKSTSEGHGRAVDIWSVGCCVVEMASGERPWAEYDSNYQIMFKVGMGETPAVPDTLSDEGHEFLSLCLKHDPRERATAALLLQHAFTKVEIEDENVSLPLPL